MQGRHLQRSMGRRPLVAVCVPLLLGTDGREKMSKSLDNFIAITETPSEMYGKLMSIPDSLLLNYYTHLTAMPQEELETLRHGLGEGRVHPMDAKKRLAHEVVQLLHGAEAAHAAQGEFERVFQQRQQPGETQDLPVALNGGAASVDITVVLTDAGLVASRGEARRLVQQGGVSIDDVKVTESQVELREGAIVKLGRHRFYKVTSTTN
jgi:tyrosyl-tRNA synthetase